MPMHTDRRRRGRRSRSELDWFAEDPWGEPETAAPDDIDDDWYPGLFQSDSDDHWELDDGEGTWMEDPSDDWGPIRRRARR